MVVDGNDTTPARPEGGAGARTDMPGDGEAEAGARASAEAPAAHASGAISVAAPPDGQPRADSEPAAPGGSDPGGPTSGDGAPGEIGERPGGASGPPPGAPAASETPPGTASATDPGRSTEGGEPAAMPDLPDHEAGRRPGGGKPLVLGGAAAAEGRTSGPHRLAGPATSSGAPAGDATVDVGEHEPRGRHFRAGGTTATARWRLVGVAVPAVAVVVLVGAWAIDTAALSGQVMRNVEVAGRDVGGLGEASLPEVMDGIAAELAERPVVVRAGDRRYDTTAGKLGLAVDTEATARAALDAGRRDSLLRRPLSWLGSFFGKRDVDVRYSVKESQVVATMLELEGADQQVPKDPTIQLGESGWVAVPGVPGRGVDTDEVIAELAGAATGAGRTGRPSTADNGGARDTEGGGDGADDPIVVEAALVDIAPRFSDAEARELAERANAMTAEGLTLTVGDVSKTVDAATLRSWVGPTTEGGALDLAIRPDVVSAAIPEIFSDLTAEPKNASFDLRDGTPVVVPSQQGVTCCGADSPELVWRALVDAAGTAALEAQVTEPEITTEEANGLGIVQPVGGNRAWRDGAATTAGPGFTTYHAAGQSRVTNIHRIADLVRGTVILPGATFSVNDTVGQRTAGKGFVSAGAIREGEHVDEIGGGVSQFATTMFNAAYFAGLEIPVYQAHSEWFSRYPPGREATMGFPSPDLKITNDTPYGVLIWTSYTAESITVTLYSTPYATAEQTGISESSSGACRVVTTTRTRTFRDGRSDRDTFRATYRPGPGQRC